MPRVRSIPLLLLPLLLLLALLLPSCEAPPRTAGVYATARRPAPDALALIHFTLRRDLPLTKGSINGQDVGYFLIDTGSAVTVVDAAVSRRLHLPQQGQIQVTGVGGMKRVPYSSIDALQIDGLALGARQAATVDLAEFNRSVGCPVAGILGWDSLRDRPFYLDYRAGVLSIPDPARFAPPAGFAACPLTELQGIPAVAADLGAGTRASMQIDTGCNSPITLPLPFIEQHPRLLAGKLNVHGQAYGVGGLGRSVNSQLDRLGVFGCELRDMPLQVELPDPITGQGPPDHGRLGNGVLRHFTLYFDYPHRQIWAVPAQ